MSRPSSLPTFAWTAVVLLTSTCVVHADQILETHDGSLTTYLPTAKSNIQDVRALVDQRGVHLDGTLRARSTHGMAMGGNPFGQDRWNGNQSLSGMRLDTGTFVVNDVDLSFPAEVPWIIGRSYNARQKDSGGSYFASGGYQGENWFQSSQPELVFYDSGTDSEDTIYLVYGADRFLEFRRGDDEGTGDSDDTFKSVNGAAGAVLIATDAEGPDLATYYDQNGNQMVFFWVGDADIDDDIEGSIWKVVDPAGNVAYVGDSSDAATALSSYDASTGAITTAYDSAGRRFTYTYTSGMLTEVKAEVNSGGWTEVGKVAYSYYVNADSHGEDDDLELVTITMPLTDSGVSSVRKKYYWYYEGTYDATNNPGYHHQLQYVIDFEGYRGYDWDQDSSLNDDPLSATEGNLKPYASSYFKYDTERRIVSAWFNGACGCSGAGTGTHTFEYESNGSYSDGAGYDYSGGNAVWKSRTTVQQPSVTYLKSAGAIESWLTQYFDEAGQPLHRVQSDDDPDELSYDRWATKVTRNSDGQVAEISSPANVTAYTHSTASFTTSTSAGLVTGFTRISSGDMKGFVDDRVHSTGTSGSDYLDGTWTYSSRDLTVGDAALTRPFVASAREYTQEITSGTTGSNVTSYSYTFHGATATDVLYLAPKQIATTNPAVSTSNNGSGSSTTRKQYVRQDGSAAFVEAEDGIFTYTAFTDGQLTKRVEDAKTSNSYPSGDDPNFDFGISETSDGQHRETTTGYDDQGRRDTVSPSDGQDRKSYYSKLSDGRLVTLQYPKYEDLATDKFYGPVSASVTNHAGRAEASGTVKLDDNSGVYTTDALTLHIDETDSDPLLAVDGIGEFARFTVNVYDETGGVLGETWAYFDIPASGAGSDGTNYDASFLGYDDQGRRVRTKEPHGTLTRTDYDTLGRSVAQWIGTSDNDFDGGESIGTDNMVKTVASEYDSGNDKGNSYLTKRTAYVQDSDTDKRETSFTCDVRGRTLLSTSATAPHTFSKFDNLGRSIASGQFSSTASINVSSDDPTTETTNRLGLNQTFYDEMGRAWKSQRHKIDDADGSDDDNLQTLTWYDEVGRVIKVDGSQLTKTSYDRIGRQTHQFILAKDDDTAYADADDVTGDIILLESQTTYESYDSDDVLMTAMISRFHDDTGGGATTGALDTNADGDALKYTAANLEGRIQITANWYDDLGRVVDTARFGTYGGSDFNRTGETAGRSDTELVTTYVYSADGSRLSITDPRNLETRFEYDDAGRQTAAIANYDDGTPSGATGDDDNYVRYVYTDGLQTKMWVDLDGDDVEDADDQVTTYTFGTTKGASAGDSKIATGHLLQEIAYPDSGGASDVVSFAYNAQSQEMWKEDQAGNVIESDFDDSGRVTHKRVTTIDADFDNAVLRISTAYDDLGRVSTVTQYNNATVGSGTVVDEVKYTYEDWGNVSKFEQDHDSAVGGTLLYDIDYGYLKATTGRNTIRRNSMNQPDGNQIDYTYSSGYDDEASRLTSVYDGLVALATYGYNGVSRLVGIDLDEVDVMWHQYGSTSGSYPDLDRFNRVTSSRWTKDLSPDRDFFDLEITYDRNSNITLIEDHILLTGSNGRFDVEYTIDNRDRLTNAEEGHWNGSTISTTTREQKWTLLGQTGNWDRVKLDLDGDGSFTGTDEYDDSRTHNVVNELTARDTDTDSTDDFTLVCDEVGNLIDDGEHYEYVFDAFGRLREVKDTGDQSTVAEYEYNGLGYRITWHYDADADGDVDSNDPTYRFVYDDRWRIVATYRGTATTSDSDPKEQFVYHNAGNDGRGGASYIDDVILRDKDANSGWTSAADGTLEERIDYCQNWRHDVVALVDSAGHQVEQDRYFAYGVPFGVPVGDVDSDGDVDSSDPTAFDSIVSYEARADLDLDGVNDSSDRSTIVSNDGDSLGFGALSLGAVANRRGYGGYELDSALSGAVQHVRNRVLYGDLGRWVTRDPLSYTDGSGLYSYATLNPMSGSDPTGLFTWKWRQTSRAFCLLELYDDDCCSWYFRETMYLGWMAGLPSCPCPEPPRGTPGWSKDGFGSRRGHYHKGAEACYRSTPPLPNGARQQCCYKGGKLITGGRGAGTPDRYDDGHIKGDVEPWDDCFDAYRTMGIGCYNEARPPNKGINCPPQIVHPIRPCPCWSLCEIMHRRRGGG